MWKSGRSREAGLAESRAGRGHNFPAKFSQKQPDLAGKMTGGWPNLAGKLWRRPARLPANPSSRLRPDFHISGLQL